MSNPKVPCIFPPAWVVFARCPKMKKRLWEALLIRCYKMPGMRCACCARTSV
jgi:hypothetical protein